MVSRLINIFSPRQRRLRRVRSLFEEAQASGRQIAYTLVGLNRLYVTCLRDAPSIEWLCFDWLPHFPRSKGFVVLVDSPCDFCGAVGRDW